MRNIVGGGNKIDVIGAFALKLQKDFGESVDGYFFAEGSAGNFVILAEDAFKGAAGKEHSSGATITAYAGFFPHVKGSAGNHQTAAFAAYTFGIVIAAGVTLAGAEMAAFVFI